MPELTMHTVRLTDAQGVVGPLEEMERDTIRFAIAHYRGQMSEVARKLRIGRFNMNWAGIIVAVVFALLHANSFDSRHWPQALGQQCYAFALGVFYAYWLEKSKSVVAPIIGHNFSDVVEYLILFAWLGAFSSL